MLTTLDRSDPEAKEKYREAASMIVENMYPLTTRRTSTLKAYPWQNGFYCATPGKQKLGITPPKIISFRARISP